MGDKTSLRFSDFQTPVGRSARAVAASVASRRGKSRTPGGGHPATSEKMYTPEEADFLSAVSSYKTTTGNMFPTNCEVLRIFKTLGYVRETALRSRDVA